MRKIVLVLAAVILLNSVPFSAGAIENGVDATGSSFVVPIKTEISPGKFIGCSGSLIAPEIVITAAHCAVDSNGLINKKIYVGDPGSKSDSIDTGDIIKEVRMTSSYQSGTYVTADDIAFLVLGNPKVLAVKVELASESEINALNVAKAQLKIYGYGRTSNADVSTSRSPSSGQGFLSRIGVNLNQPDSAIYSPIKGNSCVGDSGGPVMSITATKVLLIGVVTGGDGVGSNNCGATYTIFTLVNRYTNLAFAISLSLMESNLAASKAKDAEFNKVIEDLNIENKKLSDAGYSLSASFNTLKEKFDEIVAANTTLSTKYNETVTNANKTINEVNALNLDAWSKNKLLTNENTSLVTEISTYQVQVSTLEGEIESLKVQIEELNAKLPKTITCVKGSLTKKVTAVKPKCPSGYKVKVG
jgi:chaperonin cofactor prefoldin